MEQTLHDLLPNDWEPEQPSTIRELLDADYDGLSTTARAMRAMVVDVIHGFERVPVTSAAACRDQLERRLLPKRKSNWDLVALNDRRERIYVNRGGKNGSGGLRLVAVPSREKFPTPEVAASNAPLPPHGVYIANIGGSVNVLNDGDAFRRFAQFTASHPVADVVCWDESNDSAAFWSVAAGVGAIGSEEREFPDQAALSEWRNLLCTN